MFIYWRNSSLNHSRSVLYRYFTLIKAITVMVMVMVMVMVKVKVMVMVKAVVIAMPATGGSGYECTFLDRPELSSHAGLMLP
jgi:hypothetical protein